MELQNTQNELSKSANLREKVSYVPPHSLSTDYKIAYSTRKSAVLEP